MSHENTYWENNGKHQDMAEVMNEKMPMRGECVSGTLLELFRVSSNAYQDLFNNGMGNAELRLMPLVDEINVFRKLGVLAQGNEDVQSAIYEIETYLDEYMEAEANARSISDFDEDEEECADDGYPDCGALYEPFEVFMDFVLALCRDSDDVEARIEPLRKAA